MRWNRNSAAPVDSTQNKTQHDPTPQPTHFPNSKRTRFVVYCNLSCKSARYIRRSLVFTTMRTRSRQSIGGSGNAAEEEEVPVSLPLKSPRSSKKRRAPDTSATPSASSETEKLKGAVDTTTAVAAAVSTPPPKAGYRKDKSLEEPPKKASRSENNKQEAASEFGKAVEDQSLGGKDGTAMVPPAGGGMGVAPKGRCVSGRDWKVRNQSQRWVGGCVGGWRAGVARAVLFLSNPPFTMYCTFDTPQQSTKICMKYEVGTTSFGPDCCTTFVSHCYTRIRICMK